MTKARQILVLIASVLGAIVITAACFMIVRSCEPEPEPALVVVTPPDGGAAAVAIETRLDAAVAEHVEEVRVIERRVIVERVSNEARLLEQERAVRARGRAATADWLADFSRELRSDGGIDGGS